MQGKTKQHSWSWQLKLHANPKFLNFNFEATNILPSSSSKLYPFPIKLNLRIKLSPLLRPQKSDSVNKKGKSMKSKFLRILGNLKLGSSKNKAIAAKKTSNVSFPKPSFPANGHRFIAFEEPKCITSIVIGFIALLSWSISQRYHKGIIVYSLIILLYLAVIFNKLIRRRTEIVLVTVMLAMFSFAIGNYLSNMSKTREGYVSDCVWTILNHAWNYAPFLSGQPKQDICFI